MTAPRPLTSHLTSSQMGHFLSRMKRKRNEAPQKRPEALATSTTTRPEASKLPSGAEIHYTILERFSVSAVNEAADNFGMSVTEIAQKIGISRSTLHRKLASKGRLTEHESDALARYTALLTHATDVFAGSKEAAKSWLTTPQIGLGGAIPLDFAKTSFGYHEVDDLLGRIDYGVYS
jgi:putative toxin-antitoxin system antitoxin component (TIGR02293 family)